VQGNTLITGHRTQSKNLTSREGAKVILATAPSGKAMTEILGSLAVNGKLVIIGVSDEPIQVPSSLMISGRGSLIGWPAGTSIDSQDTLSFSVLSGVRSMNEVFPLERAAEAYDHMMSGKARFRCVLTTGNSYWLGENLPNAVLLTYPDSGHGSFFQFHESFTRHAAVFEFWLPVCRVQSAETMLKCSSLGTPLTAG
jgi:pimeloyl-ACP methyl ester carboxylesterase